MHLARNIIIIIIIIIITGDFLCTHFVCLISQKWNVLFWKITLVSCRMNCCLTYDNTCLCVLLCLLTITILWLPVSSICGLITLGYVIQHNSLSVIFHPCSFCPSFSSPAFSSPALLSVIFESCIFHPCNVVRHFPVLHFPALHFCPSFSSPAVSCPANSVAPQGGHRTEGHWNANTGSWRHLRTSQRSMDLKPLCPTLDAHTHSATPQLRADAKYIT